MHAGTDAGVKRVRYPEARYPYHDQGCGQCGRRGVEAMREAYQIIRRPLLTEKGTDLKEHTNQYLFEVARDANKIEIKRAVESVFRVNVLQVRTLSVKSKLKRVGRVVGFTPGWKKKIDTLTEREVIELLQGA